MTSIESRADTGVLRIFLLGDFRVERDGSVIEDSAWRLRKSRALVKILALTPDRRLHREQVMEYLWPGAAAGSALNSLNQVLYAARQALLSVYDGALEPNEIIRHHNQVLSLLPGYDVWIDADAFESLAREAIRTGDDRLFDEAVALFGSEVFPEDRYEDWAVGRRGDLEGLLLSLLDRFAGTFEARGEPSRAIDALRMSLTIEPAAEETHVALMRLYGSNGWRQQALHQYQLLVESLQRSAGAEPSEAARNLYRQIFDERGTSDEGQDSADEHTVTLFGRDTELSTLRAGVRSGLEGRGRVLLLAGDAGIGKTTLAETVAAPLVREGGALVYWGRCHQDEGAPAYWPWVQIFREYLREHDSATVRRDLGRDAWTIMQMVPEVEDIVGGFRPGGASGGSRFQLFDSVSSVLKRIAGRQPLLLVLDDLHWADRSSLLLLDHLAGELRSARVVILGSYRESDLGRYHPLHQTLGQLVRQPDNRRISLTGLSVEDAARVIESTTGVEPPEPLVCAVHELTEGNPFFVGEVVQLLMQQGDLESMEDGNVDGLTIPQGIREVMHHRLARLSDECGEVLKTCSVMGREFGVHVLGLALDRTPDALIDVLDEAVQSRILDEKTGEPGYYRFSHALIRETIYDDLGTALRTQIHGTIAEVLEQTYSGNVEPYLPELAHHFYRATPRHDVTRTVDYLSRAGARAMSQVGFDEASGYFQRALQVLDLATPVDYPRRCSLLLDLGDAQRGAGDSAKSRETCLQAAMLARRLNLPEHLARAASTVAWASMEIRPYDAYVVRLLEEALDALGPADSIYRVQVLGALVRALDYSGDVERRAELGDQAVAVARRLNDPETLVHALEGRLKSVIRPDNLDQSVADAEEIIRLAGIVGDSYMAILGHWWRIDAMLGKGEIAAVDQSIAIGSQLARERGEPRRIWEALCYQTMRALLAARFKDAERLAGEAVEVGQRPAPRPSWSTYIEHLFMIRREQGRLSELESDLRERVENYGDYPYYHAMYGVLLAETGRKDEAREELNWLASMNFQDVPRDVMWLATIAFLSELAYQLDDVDRALLLYDMLRPFTGRGVVPDAIEYCAGSSSYFVGLLGETIGLVDETRQAYQDAIEMNERMDAVGYLAHSLFACARWSLASDGSAGRERAAGMVARALDIAHQHHMPVLARRCISLQADVERASR